MPALVRGSIVQWNAPAKAAELLLQYPDAPYTAMLVSEQGLVPCFHQHCLRLVQGWRELARCCGEEYGKQRQVRQKISADLSSHF